jgi:plastocyanin
MQFRSYVRFAAAAGALALVSAACGGGGGVGGDLKDVNGGNKNGAIGQATTTAAPVTTAAPTVTTAKKNAPTTAAVAATPEATYIIQSDTKGQYIEPLSHTVRVGALVRFTNQDSIPHVIDGRMNDRPVLGPSPSIAPGSSWDVRPTTAGTYDIVDEQRTYAQGVTLTVSR